MKLIAFEPHHIVLIRPQAAQVHEVDPAALAESPGDRWTAVHDGLPIACGGLIPFWRGRAYAWIVLDRDAAPHLLALTRAIRSLLANSGWRRIEMAVDAEFAAGCRWADMLGFKPECLASKYLPDGRDARIFVRL